MTTRSPILHPHEVRAALAWILGLVVRPVKPQPTPDKNTGHWTPLGKGRWLNPAMAYETQDEWRCPLGVPGDRLCCRETWQEFFGDEIPQGRTRAIRGRMSIPARSDRLPYVAYRADGEMPHHPEHGKAIWRTPATMPAWASRITMEVVGVRCVRLESLTNMDAINTGIPEYLNQFKRRPYTEYEDDLWRNSTTLENMRRFWESKYGIRYPWATSWAWAVEVRRVEG